MMTLFQQRLSCLLPRFLRGSKRAREKRDESDPDIEAGKHVEPASSYRPDLGYAPPGNNAAGALSGVDKNSIDDEELQQPLRKKSCLGAVNGNANGAEPSAAHAQPSARLQPKPTFQNDATRQPAPFHDSSHPLPTLVEPAIPPRVNRRLPFQDVSPARAMPNLRADLSRRAEQAPAAADKQELQLIGRLMSARRASTSTPRAAPPALVSRSAQVTEGLNSWRHRSEGSPQRSPVSRALLAPAASLLFGPDAPSEGGRLQPAVAGRLQALLSPGGALVGRLSPLRTPQLPPSVSADLVPTASETPAAEADEDVSVVSVSKSAQRRQAWSELEQEQAQQYERLNRQWERDSVRKLHEAKLAAVRARREFAENWLAAQRQRREIIERLGRARLEAAAEESPAAPEEEAAAVEEEEDEVLVIGDTSDEEEAAEVPAAEDEAEEEEAVEEEEELEAGARELTDAQLEEYQTLIDIGNPDEVISQHDAANLYLKASDFKTFEPGGWLSDECINMYMALLQDRDSALFADNVEAPRVWFCNTFFLGKLFMDNGYNYSAVARWSQPRKFKKRGIPYKSVFELDKVVVPCHLGNHWTCACINMRDRQLEYYDSLGGKPDRILNALAQWVESEYQDKKGEAPPGDMLATTWKRIFNPRGTPRQLNGWDCGVFTVVCASYLGLDREFDYGQDEVHSFFRAMCALECRRQSLL